MLRDLGLKVKYPAPDVCHRRSHRPHGQPDEPFADPQAAEMIAALRKNVEEFGITYFDLSTGKQGIVHVSVPNRGSLSPAPPSPAATRTPRPTARSAPSPLVSAPPRSRDVLATQTMAIGKMKVRRINVEGRLGPGVYAKDVILHIIALLGAKGGIGYAYEYGGEVIDRFSIEERMTVCNMSIEGGARCGYVNPDEKTFAYLKGARIARKEPVGRGGGTMAVVRQR